MTAVAYIWYNENGEPLAPTEYEMLKIEQRRPAGSRPTFQPGCIHNFRFVRSTRAELDRQIERFGRILARYAPQARILHSRIIPSTNGYAFYVTYSVEDPNPANHRRPPALGIQRIAEPNDADEPVLMA